MSWKEKFMKNMVSIETLNKLVAADKLTQNEVNSWVAERQELYGY